LLPVGGIIVLFAAGEAANLELAPDSFKPLLFLMRPVGGDYTSDVI